MFAVIQIPFSDLRIFAKDKLGRLSKPDWNADDPTDSFVRGFGRMTTRNSGGFGLVGERAFADFRQAVLFEGSIMYQQQGWARPLRIKPWFRRLYFDGGISGRLEFGFLVSDADEAFVLSNRSASALNAASITELLLSTPVRIVSSDLPDERTSLGRSGDAVGLAYLAATTERKALYAYPIAETMGHHFFVGRPAGHLRLNAAWKTDMKADAREVFGDADGGLYTSSMQLKNQHYSLLIQRTLRGTQDESGQERALRVLFAHLNSLIFAASTLVEKNETDISGESKKVLRDLTERMVVRFSKFAPSGPTSKDDDVFAAALRAFGVAYVGRTDALAEKLGALASTLNKPTTLQRTGQYGKALFELLLTTALKTAVETAAKPQ